MKSIYGICNVSPFIIDSYINKYEKSSKRKFVKQILSTSPKKGIKKNVDIVFAISLSSMLDKLEYLNKVNAVVLVFDSPLLLTHSGITLLDTKVNKDRTQYKFIKFNEKDFINLLDKSLKLRQNYTFDKISTNLSFTLLNNRQSITQMLLFLTLNSKESYKKKITSLLIKWLLDGGKIKDLIASLDDYVDKHYLHLLMDFLVSDIGKNTRKVFTQLKITDKDKIKPLCKKYKVSTFDVLFLLSQIPSNKN